MEEFEVDGIIYKFNGQLTPRPIIEILYDRSCEIDSERRNMRECWHAGTAKDWSGAWHWKPKAPDDIENNI